MKRTNAVMVRLDDAQVRELDALAAAVGIPASTLAHAAVLGMLRGYRRHGRMSLPLELVPASDLAPVDEMVLNEARVADDEPRGLQAARRKRHLPRVAVPEEGHKRRKRI